jgi:HAE1 family hydrophobic/amphiphilic exporter-1
MVRRLKTLPDVAYTYTTIGAAGTTSRPATEGVTFVKLQPGSGKTFSQVLGDARRVIQEVPGMTYGLFEAGPFGQKPIQISVRGAEIDELDRISRELMQEMGKMKGVADIETSLEKAKPELRVRVDRERASDLGVPAGVIGTTLRAAVSGEVASVIEDSEGDSYDVRVRLRADQRRYARTCSRSPCHDKDDDNQDKLLGAAARAGAHRARHGPLDDPPQGPGARGARLRQPRRPLARRDQRRRRGRRSRGST